jgi:hypothetical protein
MDEANRDRPASDAGLTDMTSDGRPRVVPRGVAARGLAALLRFFGLWAGISGAYAVMGGTCPCCGRVGCPVGIGAAAVLGGLGSLFVFKGRALLTRLWLSLRRGRNA